MADTFKVLAQLNPSATTLTTLYTVPAATSTVVSMIMVCNQTSSPVTFRLSVAIAGAADNIKQYLYYEVSIPANDSFKVPAGITLATTDLIRCYASSASMSFTVFGDEIT